MRILLLFISFLISVSIFGQGRDQALKEASSLMNEGEYELARQQYKLLTDLDNRDGYAWMMKGVALYHLEEYNLAMSSFIKADSYEVKDPELGYYVGLIHRKGRFFQDAKDAFLISLESDSLMPEIQHYIGEAYYFLKDYPQAIYYLKNELEINPNSAYVNHYLSKTYLEKGKIDSANVYNQKSIELNKLIPRFRLQSGDLNFAQEEYVSALIDYNEALKLNPNYKDALVSRAGTYMMLEHYSLAKSDFELLSEMDKTQTGLVYKRGVADCYQKMGEWDKAQELYKDLIYASASKRDRDLAVSELVNKNDIDIKSIEEYAKIKYQMDGAEEAKAIFLNLHKRFPDVDRYLFELGNAYYLIGDLKNALIAVKECIKRNPKHFGAWYNKSIILFDQERFEHACHIWREIVEKADDEFYVEQAQAALESEGC